METEIRTMIVTIEVEGREPVHVELRFAFDQTQILGDFLGILDNALSELSCSGRIRREAQLEIGPIGGPYSPVPHGFLNGPLLVDDLWPSLV